MARFTIASIQRRMSPIVVVAVAGLVVVAPRARASDSPPGPGVSVLPNGYNPHADTPGKSESRNPATAAPGADDPVKSGGDPNGCLAMVPGIGCMQQKCADPAGTGVCDGQGGVPTVTPAELAQQAWNALRLPLPGVHTAPPRGAAGLVGLPEWVWVPASQWRPLTKRASAGGVWAEVTATPRQMIVTPGAGLGAVMCAGPGTAYDRQRSASSQQTDCSYTYARSSAGQPGAVYRVTVRVVWGGVWVGSGGAGGTLPDISRSTTFGLRVAEAQSLYR